MSRSLRGYPVRASRDSQSVAQCAPTAPHHPSTRVLLVRHAHTDALGRTLCGRRTGITLSGVGVLQAEELARALCASSIAAFYSSPLERAQMTATIIARPHGARPRLCDDLIEIDFGAWTGKTFDELSSDPAWHAFNVARARAVIPDGESIAGAQRRIVKAVARLAARHHGEAIVLVSHADVVRSALLHYREMSLDRYHEFEIGPASVSAVDVTATGRVQVVFINRGAHALTQ